MEELVRWLGEQLDKDEALAREAPPGPWLIGNAVDPTKPCSVHTFPDVRLVADGLNWLVAEHIAHHNPARVLREIDAKRQLLALHQEKLEQGYGSDLCAECGFGEVSQSYYPCATLRLLALPYTDRPGYREEWRP